MSIAPPSALALDDRFARELPELALPWQAAVALSEPIPLGPTTQPTDEDLQVCRLALAIALEKYALAEPIPVHGNWKSLIRLHDDSSLTALPIYLPRDEAIPVEEVPASAQFTRTFGDEHKLLQRESKGGSPVLVAIAYSVVGGITLSLLALLAWALHRLAVDMRPAPLWRRLRARALALQHGGGR